MDKVSELLNWVLENSESLIALAGVAGAVYFAFTSKNSKKALDVMTASVEKVESTNKNHVDAAKTAIALIEDENARNLIKHALEYGTAKAVKRFIANNDKLTPKTRELIEKSVKKINLMKGDN